MKFLLVRRQRGSGCDYTIGCGIAVSEFEAANVSEALAELRRDTIRGGDGFGIRDSDEGIEWARLVPLDTVIADWFVAHDREERRAERARERDRERAEYERLHAKFGKP